MVSLGQSGYFITISSMTIRHFLIIPALWALTLLGKSAFQLYNLKKRLQVEQLAKMHRRDFETYIASKLKLKGRKKVRIGKGVADGGRDVRGSYNWKNFVIQCKCYKTSASIGVKTVRELLGVLKSSEESGIAVLCSTCQFTKPARDFARKNGIQLRGRENLLERIY